MEKLSREVTAYINKSEGFAKPILEYCREIVHKACPDVAEVIKWGIPHFDYKDDFMCVMASYKAHCSFTFIKAEIMADKRLKENKQLKPIQRFLGKITNLKEMPPEKEFVAMLKDAMMLNEKGIKVVAEKSDKPKVLETPDYLIKALKQNTRAKEVFESKSNSFRKEYIVWISSAKSDETRNKRIVEALKWIAEGKSRFWKSKK
jgi:uncharacterized protein YdeI (YjbR/CyaY-like superfamily)